MVTRLTDYTKQFWSLLSTDDTDPLVPHNGDEAILIDRNERYVFDEENQTWRQIPLSGGGGGSSGLQWTLVGSESIAMAEYTGTATETTSTTINIANTDYAYLLFVITCDSPITSSTEWGMSVGVIGRYSPPGNALYVPTDNGMQQWGTATLSQSLLSHQMQAISGYGVVIKNAESVIKIYRRCLSAGQTPDKCRAGNYTVAVYGLTSL